MTSSFTRFFAALTAALLTTSLVVVTDQTTADASTACSSGITPGNDPTSWSQNPRPISTPEELIYLSEMANISTSVGGVSASFVRATYLNANYVLTGDINLQGCEWRPIGRGTSGSPQNPTPDNSFFTGTFDGGNKTISGFRLVTTGNELGEEIGLFGRVTGGPFNDVIYEPKIYDLMLEGSMSTGLPSGITLTIGSVAGLVTDGLISNVHVDVDISLTASDSSRNHPIGGLVGYVVRSVVESSSSRGDVIMTGTVDTGWPKPVIGSLAGRIESSGATIRHSYASGDVSAPEHSILGGLVGLQLGSSLGAGIIDSYYISGTVSGGDQAGGLVGFFEVGNENGGQVNRTYAAAQVSGPSNPAGLIHTSDGGPVLNSFWDEELSGLSVSAGGTGKTTEQMRDIETFSAAGWDIIEGWDTFDPDNDLVWGICSGLNDGYPYLLWQFAFEEAVAATCAEDPNAVVTPDPAPTDTTDPAEEKEPLSETPAAASTPERRASAPAIHLDLQVAVGEAIAGAPVVIGGEGLFGGSDYSLVVRSTPQVVDSGKASALGNFSKRVAMPALAPGNHTLTLTATAPDGSTLTLVQGFSVGANGMVTAVGTAAGSAGPALAATGSNQLAMLWSVGLAMLVMVAGLTAVAASRRDKAAPVR